MEQLKLYLKSKEFIICNIVIIIMISFGIYDYVQYSTSVPSDAALFPNWVNRFSFWRHTMFYGLGSVLMFLSPFIISILGISMFYYKIKGSYLKDALLRQNYKNLLNKEIIKAYIKAYLPFFLCSLFVFLIGSIFYTAKISNLKYADPYTTFSYVGNFSPYIYILLSQISLLFYVILIINISLIVLRYTRKMIVTLILSFALINALNFLISNISIILKNIFGANPIINLIFMRDIWYNLQSLMLLLIWEF